VVKPLVLLARAADHPAHRVVIFKEGEGRKVDLHNADLGNAHQQIAVAYLRLELGVETLDLGALPRLSRNVLKAADQTDDLSVDDQRAFARDDVPVLASGHALAAHAVGAHALAQNALLVVPVGVRLRVPAHVLVVFADDVALVPKAIIIQKRAVRAEKTAVGVLPENRGLGRGEDVREQDVLPAPVCGGLALQLRFIVHVAEGGIEQIAAVALPPDTAPAGEPAVILPLRGETAERRESAVGLQAGALKVGVQLRQVVRMDAAPEDLNEGCGKVLAPRMKAFAKAVGQRQQRKALSPDQKNAERDGELFVGPLFLRCERIA